ncbi:MULTISPECIES: hypothetical protein [unclassified Caballeronia]|uniref:hypothetical protein n=1 Tax=unclassified Caballeronia TaxID=2646786 RepID=UPI00285754A6|nr:MULTISPECIES: hypothetical protein [unclassified Caballeronia]MDR5751086.1 hypothetical protein [Caballeronia sp. LZ024]MDR5844779.1 hypothetical protein [Caballeronia sp. LZ031]
MSKIKTAFTLPTNEQDARARMALLTAAMDRARPLAEQLEKLMAAKDEYRTALAEAEHINANLDAIKLADWERRVDEFKIDSVKPTEHGDSHLLRGFQVIGTHKGTPFAQSLYNGDRAMYAALAKVEHMIPAHIRAWHADANESLLKAYRFKQLGYVAA